MSKPEKNIEKASNGALSAAVQTAHTVGLEKTIKVATNELIRRTNF